MWRKIGKVVGLVFITLFCLFVLVAFIDYFIPFLKLDLIRSIYNTVKDNPLFGFLGFVGLILGIGASFKAFLETSKTERVDLQDRRHFRRFREKYLNQLIERHNSLQFTGIPDPKEKKDVALPSVFVMQRVAEDISEEDDQALLREPMRAPGEEIKFSHDEMEARQSIRLPVPGREKSKPVKFDKVLGESNDNHYVLLGKPGSGKTTLLKYLMLKSGWNLCHKRRKGEARLFPVLIEIRKFETALNRSTKNGYCIRDYLYDSLRTEYNLDLPSGFFEYYLEKGNTLILFDGLDEVADESRRTHVQGMISSFITAYNKTNTVVITSRITGYSRTPFSTSQFRHFTIQDFNDDEIDEFISKWYRSRLKNETDAQQKAEDLKAAINRKPRIKELTQNPLLLTIIAIIHRYEAQLPEDRLILYDKATEALLYTWDNVKEIIDEKFKLEYKRQFLEKVAIQLQSCQQSEGAGTYIDRHELYQILCQDFERMFNCQRREAMSLLDEFLDKIRTRSGLLVEVAPDQFGFVHKTFQEYFAAKFIANEAILKFNLQIFLRYIDNFLDSPFWQEVMLLAIRALPKEQAQTVLAYIIERDNLKEINQHLFHNHYFVLKFIGEQGQWLNDRTFVENQIKEFFTFSWNDGKDRSFLFNKTWNRFINWLSSVTDSLSVSLISEFCLSFVEDENKEVWLRRSCAEAIGNLCLKDQSVLDRLMKLAENEKQEGLLRNSCALAVGKLGLKDQAVDILMKLAEDEKQEGWLRRACALSVGNLGLKDQAVDILMKLAEDEKQRGWLNRSCAEAVGNIGVKDRTVIDRLIKLAEDKSQEGLLRRSCAFAVGNLGLKDQEIINRLIKLAEDENQGVLLRRSCAFAVRNLGVKDQTLVERLLKLAEDKNQDGLLRRACAEAVGNLRLKNQAAEERLLKLVEDAGQGTRLRSACALTIGDMGFGDQTVVDRLIKLAKDGKQMGWLRGACAFAVGKLGFKDQSVKILLKLAEDEDQDGLLRRACAEAVGNLGVKDRAVDILTELYLKQEDKFSDLSKRIYSSLWDLTAI